MLRHTKNRLSLSSQKGLFYFFLSLKTRRIPPNYWSEKKTNWPNAYWTVPNVSSKTEFMFVQNDK